MEILQNPSQQPQQIWTKIYGFTVILLITLNVFIVFPIFYLSVARISKLEHITDFHQYTISLLLSQNSNQRNLALNDALNQRFGTHRDSKIYSFEKSMFEKKGRLKREILKRETSPYIKSWLNNSDLVVKWGSKWNPSLDTPKVHSSKYLSGVGPNEVNLGVPLKILDSHTDTSNHKLNPHANFPKSLNTYTNRIHENGYPDYEHNDYFGPEYYNYQKSRLQNNEEINSDWVWLSSVSRLPLNTLGAFCRSAIEYCPPGIPGPIGPKGTKGDRGFQGLNGEKGSPGIPGYNGMKGQIGEKGDRGEIGFPGIPGMHGEPGRKGIKGDIGEPGIPGVDGIPGKHGDVGAMGLPGVNGKDGIPGWPGEPGPPGLIGPVGLFGPKGDKGDRGFDGLNGLNGYPGRRGKPGFAGDPGLKGQKGERGNIGPQGPPGTAITTVQERKIPGNTIQYYLNAKISDRSKKCILKAVGKPVFMRYTGTFWGTWMKDTYPQSQADTEKIWVTKHFNGKELYEYSDETAFKSDNVSQVYTLPQGYEGNGHVILAGSLYYHITDSPRIGRYDLRTQRLTDTLELPRAAYHDEDYLFSTPYNYMDINVDETGLYVIYSTADSMDYILIAKLSTPYTTLKQTIVDKNHQNNVNLDNVQVRREQRSRSDSVKTFDDNQKMWKYLGYLYDQTMNSVEKDRKNGNRNYRSARINQNPITATYITTPPPPQKNAKMSIEPDFKDIKNVQQTRYADKITTDSTYVWKESKSIASIDSSFDIEKMWNVSVKHKSLGNAFIACGIVYGLKDTDIEHTVIDFAYDLYDNEGIYLVIPYDNPYQKTTMLSFNPYDQSLYSWDRGNQLKYPVRFEN